MESHFSYAMLAGDHQLQGTGERMFIRCQSLVSEDVVRLSHVRWATAQTQAVHLQAVEHSLVRATSLVLVATKARLATAASARWLRKQRSRSCVFCPIE